MPHIENISVSTVVQSDETGHKPGFDIYDNNEFIGTQWATVAVSNQQEAWKIAKNMGDAFVKDHK